MSLALAIAESNLIGDSCALALSQCCNLPRKATGTSWFKLPMMVDGQNPWPGLVPFNEDAAPFSMVAKQKSPNCSDDSYSSGSPYFLGSLDLGKRPYCARASSPDFDRRDSCQFTSASILHPRRLSQFGGFLISSAQL